MMCLCYYEKIRAYSPLEILAAREDGRPASIIFFEAISVGYGIL